MRTPQEEQNQRLEGYETAGVRDQVIMAKRLQASLPRAEYLYTQRTERADAVVAMAARSAERAVWAMTGSALRAGSTRLCTELARLAEALERLSA